MLWRLHYKLAEWILGGNWQKSKSIDPCLFCIDASAYLILDIALLAVLPDRAGRIALDVENIALYNAKKLRTNLETSQTRLYHHDFFFFFKQKNLETYNCEVTKIFFWVDFTCFNNKNMTWNFFSAQKIVLEVEENLLMVVNFDY